MKKRPMSEWQRAHRRARGVVNAREAAVILKVGLRTVRRWQRKGLMPEPVKTTSPTTGRIWTHLVLWSEADITAMAQTRAIELRKMVPHSLSGQVSGSQEEGAA